MLNNIAHQKPATSNPLIMLAANKISKALMTKVNNPRLIIFIGKVSRMSNGRNNKFIIANKAASQIAVRILTTVTPGKT